MAPATKRASSRSWPVRRSSGEPSPGQEHELRPRPVRRGWGRVEGGGGERATRARAQERRPLGAAPRPRPPHAGRPRPARPLGLSAVPGGRIGRMPGVGEAGVRAGILVTGTEVLSGFITDRNGPWVSERLGRAGGGGDADRAGRRPPRGPGGGAGRHARPGDGPDRHHRRPRADGGRPHRRGRGALRRAGARPRRGDGGQDPRDPEGVRQALQLRRGRPARRQPQAGDGARGRHGDRPGRHRPGVGGPRWGGWW